MTSTADDKAICDRLSAAILGQENAHAVFDDARAVSLAHPATGEGFAWLLTMESEAILTHHTTKILCGWLNGGWDDDLADLRTRASIPDNETLDRAARAVYSACRERMEATWKEGHDRYMNSLRKGIHTIIDSKERSRVWRSMDDVKSWIYGELCQHSLLDGLKQRNYSVAPTCIDPAICERLSAAILGDPVHAAVFADARAAQLAYPATSEGFAWLLTMEPAVTLVHFMTAILCTWLNSDTGVWDDTLEDLRTRAAIPDNETLNRAARAVYSTRRDELTATWDKGHKRHMDSLDESIRTIADPKEQNRVRRIVDDIKTQICNELCQPSCLDNLERREKRHAAALARAKCDTDDDE